jgi:molecular chaperone Hsp33
MNGVEMKVLDEMPIQFKCDCSKDKFAKSLTTLSKDNLQKMIDEDHGAEAVCKFCNNKYKFTEADLKEIIAEKE